MNGFPFNETIMLQESILSFRLQVANKLSVHYRHLHRNKQLLFNQKNNITPKSVSKRIKDLIDGVYDSEQRSSQIQMAQAQARYENMSEVQLAKEIQVLEKHMLESAKNLEFEKAAQYRDQIKNLKNKLFIGFIEPDVSQRTLKSQASKKA